MKIGMKMTMISVHSRGQPSRKMITCARSMNWVGVMFIDFTQVLMISWPPRRAKAAAKVFEPMKSQQTMAEVFAVRKTDSLTTVKLSRLYAAARTNPPKDPMAAASVGVASPTTIVPKTPRMIRASGKNDPRSILKISRRAKVKIT